MHLFTVVQNNIYASHTCVNVVSQTVRHRLQQRGAHVHAVGLRAFVGLYSRGACGRDTWQWGIWMQRTFIFISSRSMAVACVRKRKWQQDIHAWCGGNIYLANFSRLNTLARTTCPKCSWRDMPRKGAICRSDCQNRGKTLGQRPDPTDGPELQTLWRWTQTQEFFVASLSSLSPFHSGLDSLLGIWLLGPFRCWQFMAQTMRWLPGKAGLLCIHRVCRWDHIVVVEENAK